MAAGIQIPGNDETIDLQQQVARLQALLEASRQVHSTIHEEEVLEQVLRIVVRELEMAGAAFPGTGMAYGDEIVLDGPGTAGAGDPALARYPLSDREGKLMAELIVAAPDGRELTLYEADFIEGLALQAAVALENARNHKRNIAFARVQQDMDAARLIQRSLLPQKLPSIPGYSMSFRSVTCYEVGGDYLDLVEQPDGSLLIVVADVAGKGLASAIMATSFRAAFRAMAITGMPLDELATRMNQHHFLEGEEARRRYVTAIFLRLHPDLGEIEVVNAGHNPGFLVAPGAEPHEFNAAGTPLGLLPGMQYSAERTVSSRDRGCCFTPTGSLKCSAGMKNLVRKGFWMNFLRARRKSRWYSRCIVDSARLISAEGGPQGDDMTALALCRDPRRRRRHEQPEKHDRRGSPALAHGIRESGHEHGCLRGQADGLPRRPH